MIPQGIQKIINTIDTTQKQFLQKWKQQSVLVCLENFAVWTTEAQVCIKCGARWLRVDLKMLLFWQVRCRRKVKNLNDSIKISRWGTNPREHEPRCFIGLYECHFLQKCVLKECFACAIWQSVLVHLNITRRWFLSFMAGDQHEVREHKSVGTKERRNPKCDMKKYLKNCNACGTAHAGFRRQKHFYTAAQFCYTGRVSSANMKFLLIFAVNSSRYLCWKTTTRLYSTCRRYNAWR